MSEQSDDLNVDDFFTKVDAMRQAGKHPGTTVMEELRAYMDDVDSGEVKFDAEYFERQMWLLYIAGVAQGTDKASSALSLGNDRTGNRT